MAISTATYLLDKLVTVFSTPATEEEDCAIKAAGITLFQAICAIFNPPSPEYRLSPAPVLMSSAWKSVALRAGNPRRGLVRGASPQPGWLRVHTHQRQVNCNMTKNILVLSRYHAESV